jgi:hypothetical protein
LSEADADNELRRQRGGDDDDEDNTAPFLLPVVVVASFSSIFRRRARSPSPSMSTINDDASAGAVEQKLRIFMMNNYVSSLSMRSRFPLSLLM